LSAGEPAAKRRILFVDDEQNVLDGLRNLLRKQRHKWDMLFALSGKAALEELARSPVDVIVSDMRMPGMDGAELLTRVRELYPQTARIVLSGHAERDAIARVVSVAHQFLSKPADATAVLTVVERTCQFQALMQDDNIRRVVGGLQQLPSLPDTFWQLVRATEDPKVSIADIARIVERDPAMSVKVLQLVNSAYFGLAQKTESIARAVTYLGVENLKGLLVAEHIFKTDDFPAIEGLSPTDMRDECVLTGTLARQIVKDPKLSDGAFAAGIVLDVGHIVLARDPTKHYGDVWRAARASGEPIRIVEQRELGVTHGIVGAYLLGVWGLPYILAEAVAFHDIPSSVTEGNIELLAAVHLADGVVAAAFAGKDPLAGDDLDVPFLNRVGLLTEVGKWYDKAVAAVALLRAGA
jgi:HD-like signal output (HDOD) protein